MEHNNKRQPRPTPHRPHRQNATKTPKHQPTNISIIFYKTALAYENKPPDITPTHYWAIRPSTNTGLHLTNTDYENPNTQIAAVQPTMQIHHNGTTHYATTNQYRGILSNYYETPTRIVEIYNSYIYDANSWKIPRNENHPALINAGAA